jgi:hypothetical protein
MTQSTSTDATSVSLEAVSNLLEVLYQLRADLEVIIETWVRTKGAQGEAFDARERIKLIGINLAKNIEAMEQSNKNP